MIVTLNRKERRMIRKIARIQLESLYRMLNSDCEEDITLECIQREIDIDRLQGIIKNNIEDFEYIMEQPESFLQVTPDQISTIRHILVNLYPYPFGSTRQSIWKKININESITLN